MTNGEWEVIGNFVAVQKKMAIHTKSVKVSPQTTRGKRKRLFNLSCTGYVFLIKTLVNWLEIPGEHGRGFCYD